jgi:hypothetical protein
MKLQPSDPDKHHSLTYPMDIGAPKFELVPVKKQKDLMLNAARMYAQQEYNRIMELVSVLQKQAEELKRRLDVTDMVHAAEYKFQIFHGQIYWLAFDSSIQNTVLLHSGPEEWTTGAPDKYEYICRVQYLGDHTWIEVFNEEVSYK